MQTLIAIWSIIRELMPQVLEMIQVIETHFPQSGQGAAKLDMVRNALASTFATLDQTAVTFEQVWPTLAPIIGGAVAIYNSTGLFRKAA